jgi:hypothetical protein
MLATAYVMRTTWDKARTMQHRKLISYHPHLAAAAIDENACKVKELWPPQS